jgi:hypothetical protein
MVAIVVAAEAFVAADWPRFTEASALAWPMGVRAAEREAVGARILCFGDSLIKSGIVPEVLEARLGEPAFNLALPASTAPAHYFLLRRALRAGARPRAIVVDYMPGLLLGTPDFGLPYWAEILSFDDYADFYRTWRHVAFLTEVTVRCLSPSFQARWAIRDNLRVAFAGEADTREATNNPMLRRNWTLHRGGQFTQDNPLWTGEPNAEEYRRHLSDRFWCHPVNLGYIHRFLGLAESQGIRVYWVLPPVTPRIQEKRVASGSDEKYTRFVREVASQHRNVTVLDARASGYAHTKFVDAIHLCGKGALALSADVAEAIAGPPVAWAALPPYREHQPPHLLENLEESRAAVIAAREATRRR